MSNFKVEANYGINKFIELGIFTGFQHYEWLHYEWLDEDFLYDELNESFAPLFGVNANFHILPFLVPAKECRWDLYLTAKYGGCYLPHKELDMPEFEYSKYRHEYGLGLGAGYYFKNIIGIFAEGALGQFFYFYKENRILVYDPTVPSGGRLLKLNDSNFRFRIGIAAKF